MNELEAMRPLYSDDQDFPVVIAAMKRAYSQPIVKSGGPRYWLVDTVGGEVEDMVSVVDLASFGNIARGSTDWVAYSGNLRLYPVADRHAASDVLEAVVHGMRKLRREAPSPSGP
jgi:hypothetical protein